MAGAIMNEVAAATGRLAWLLLTGEDLSQICERCPDLFDSQKGLDVARGSCWRSRISRKFARDVPIRKSKGVGHCAGLLLAGEDLLQICKRCPDLFESQKGLEQSDRTDVGMRLPALMPLLGIILPMEVLFGRAPSPGLYLHHGWHTRRFNARTDRPLHPRRVSAGSLRARPYPDARRSGVSGSILPQRV